MGIFSFMLNALAGNTPANAVVKPQLEHVGNTTTKSTPQKQTLESFKDRLSINSAPVAPSVQKQTNRITIDPTIGLNPRGKDILFAISSLINGDMFFLSVDKNQSAIQFRVYNSRTPFEKQEKELKDAMPQFIKIMFEKHGVAINNIKLTQVTHLSVFIMEVDFV